MDTDARSTYKISSKEFTTHQKKYYNKAVSENVFIKRGKNMFIISIANDKKELSDPVRLTKTALDRALEDIAAGRVYVAHTPKNWKQ